MAESIPNAQHQALRAALEERQSQCAGLVEETHRLRAELEAARRERDEAREALRVAARWIETGAAWPIGWSLDRLNEIAAPEARAQGEGGGA